MKHKISAFIHSLTNYDYMLFGAILFLFVLFIIVAIIIRHRLVLSVILVILSFVLLIAGPFVGYFKLHEYLYKNKIEIHSEKKLQFTKAIVVYANIQNISNLDFKECKITAKVSKFSKKKIKDYLYRFKPIKKMSIVEEDIKKGEVREFKMIIEPFTYTKKYNLELESLCR